jgi:hypothetical protein
MKYQYYDIAKVGNSINLLPKFRTIGRYIKDG